MGLERTRPSRFRGWIRGNSQRRGCALPSSRCGRSWPFSCVAVTKSITMPAVNRGGGDVRFVGTRSAAMIAGVESLAATALIRDFAPGEGVAAGAAAPEHASDGWIEVSVPGDVHSALVEA